MKSMSILAKKDVTVIIAAAGSGARMGGVYKPLELLLGKPMICYCLDVFQSIQRVKNIVICARQDKIQDLSELCEKYFYTKVSAVVPGGNTRQESVKNAFKAAFSCPGKITKFICIHDAARPLLTKQDAENAFDFASKKGCAVCASKVRDTVKKTDKNDVTKESVDRNGLWLVQTPQVFDTDIYHTSLCCMENSAEQFTDDSSIVNGAGFKTLMCPTPSYNIKITYPEDMYLAQAILQKRQGESLMRIGHGYDVHRLCEGRKLILGGVDIENSCGLDGHSDADVLVHALMDAMLGASGLGDIGRLFPDTDDEFLGISSLVLLERVTKKIMENKGLTLVNADITVVAQAPKLSPYVDSMIENISKVIGCRKDCINIKATTEEKLGFTGRKEGISAHAVVLMKTI